MKLRNLSIYVLSGLLVASVVGVALAAGEPPRRDFTETAVNPTQTDYIMVKFADPPAASYKGGIPGLEPTKPERGKFDPNSPAARAYLTHLQNVHANYRSWLARNASRAEIVREFTIVFNGMAIKLNGARPQRAGGGPGAQAWVFSALYQPTMNVSVDLINASDVWPDAGGRGNAGGGIKVGVIDTGIDETHFFFGCKGDIVHKVYTSGVAFDPSNVLVFDHGTHVSGTIAGCVESEPNVGTISGVAPAAELWDYNVFPGFGAGFVAFGGSAFSHDIAAALEDTVLDEMDVVNMSLGGGVQGPHDFLAEAVNSTFDAGIVVAVAAGNSGPGDSTVESPGSAANALTAGATTNSHVLGVEVEVVDGGTNSYLAAAGDFDPYQTTTAVGETLVNWADTGDAVTACTPATNSTPIVGNIALISRGTCTFTTKIRNAEDAGAFGVLVYNNVAGPPVGMAHDGTSPFPIIPAVMVSNVDGAAILASLPATASIDGTTLGEFATTPDILAGFSSRGPSPFNFLIKPDLTAPGVNVYSSVFNDEFALFQGTSMATPHLAGAAALLIDLHPTWSPSDIKSAIVNTAADVVTDGTSDPGLLARGNGRVDVLAAHNTPLTFAPVSASFGFWGGNKNVSASLDLAILNVSGSSQTCTVAVTGPPIVTASDASISLENGDSETLTLTLNAGKANVTPSGDYDGEVVIDCNAGSPTLRVPWWVRIDR